MLLDRGPIDPIDVERWTSPEVGPPLAGDAAALAGQLAAGDGAIAASQSIMASGATSGMDGIAGADLDDAAAAHDRQADDFDSSIGAIAANADALHVEGDGAASDAAGDVTSAAAVDFGNLVIHPTDPAGVPPTPGRDPNSQDPGVPDDGGPDRFTLDVTEFYRVLLGRLPSVEEINIHRGNPGGLEGVRQTILHSDEYKALHPED